MKIYIKFYVVIRLLITVPIFSCMDCAFSQSISDIPVAKLPGVYTGSAYIADLNNDAVRDIIYITKIDEAGFEGFVFLQTAPMTFDLVDSIPGMLSPDLFVADIDNNGEEDLIIKKVSGDGQVLTALMNYQDSIGFDEKPLFIEDTIESYSCEDFNNDGLKDILITLIRDGKEQFSVFLQNNNLSFTESLTTNDISHFLAANLNGDSFMDLVLYDSLHKELSYYITRQYMSWDTLKTSFSHGISKWEITDINHDGMADILFLPDQVNSITINCLIDSAGRFSEREVYHSDSPVTLISTGDFTNDGLYDITIRSGSENLLLTLNTVGEPGSIDTIAMSGNIVIYSAGDIDDDGDLDWIGVSTGSDSTVLHLLINNLPEKNHGPSFVRLSYPVTLGGFTKFAWYRSVDDKTPTKSISYDFYLKSVNEDKYLVTSDYDMENNGRNGIRYISRYGYTLFDTIYNVESLNSGKYLWGVAGVDNAYYSETDIRNCNGKGTCSNNNFSFQCLEIVKGDTLICAPDTLELHFGNNDDSVTWQASGKGVIGYGNLLRYPVITDDEVYAIAIPQFPCNDPANTCIKNYDLSIKTEDRPDINFFNPDKADVCLGSLYYVNVQIPDSLRGHLSYSIYADNQLLDYSNPEITVSQPIQLTFIASYGGCSSITDTMFVNPISPPVIEVKGEDKIYQGRSTFLTASGAQHFQWSPTGSLESPGSNSTLASPTVTTTYSVTGWDVNGCTGTADITVEIIPSIFIPELFTPNNDGNNDRLVIYGRNIRSLNFTIYDGNGRNIYNTTSVPEITQTGWDGMLNGKQVPPGTYVWVIEGYFENGMPLTYYGKNKGEIKILR